MRKPLAGLAIAAVIAATFAIPSGAAVSTGQVPGVTDDEILVVALVADLDGLRSRGLDLPEKLTTDNLLRRWRGYADAFGEINGRRVVVEPAVWDPLDATTFDEACTQATQDQQPFVVVNGNGYRQSAAACITVDNDTPFFFGESVYPELQKASGKNLVSLGVPADVNARTTAALAQQAELIPPSAKIGLLSANEPGIKSAGDNLEKELTRSDFDVVEKVEVNTLQADTTAINRESAAAVETLKAAGADTVLVMIPFTASVGFYQESTRTNAGFEVFIVDASSSLCTQFGASRTPAEVVGVPCITTWDTRAVATKDGIKEDNEFEAECRSQFDEFSEQQSQPGVPSGDIEVGDETFIEDFPPAECTIMSLLLPAIEKAGRNLTWDKVYANLLKTTQAPGAYMSNGRGGFAKNKPYFATHVHIESLSTANADTPQDANGVTFNGCPAPVYCWVPILVDGEEWFPIVKKGKG
ncbi:MAG: ABC transporter substrate-binding protein [Acidimicrobiia bacterium]